MSDFTIFPDKVLGPSVMGAGDSETEDDGLHDLRTVDTEGELLTPRIASPRAMRAIFDDYAAADEQASRTRAKVRGLVDGNPPFNRQKLRDAGQADRHNFNDGVAGSVMDSRCAADFNLAYDTASVAEFGFIPGTFPDPRVELEKANQLSTAYTRTFMTEPCLVEGSQRAFRDRNIDGVGFLLHDRDDDWRFRGISRNRVFFGKNASTNVGDDFDEPFFVTDTMPVNRLAEIIGKGGVSEKGGWNIEALRRALVRFFYAGSGDNDLTNRYPAYWEKLQTRIREQDTDYVSRQYASFSIIHGYVMEPSGKVSHYILPYDSATEPAEYLYEAYEKFDSPSDVIHPLAYDYGDGTLRSVQGLGQRIFAPCTVSSRKLCATLDSADLGGSLLLKDLGGGDNLAMSFIRRGPVTLIDRNLEPQQTAFNPPIEPHMAVRKLVHELLNNNVGIFRPNAEVPDRQSAVKTAEQIRAEQGQEARIERDRQFFFYLQLDRVHAATLKRLLDPKLRRKAGKTAKRGYDMFYGICEAYGMTDEFFKAYGDKIVIRTTRSVGSGSITARLNSLLQTKGQVFTSLDEIGRREMDRAIASATLGPDNVDKFIPPIPRDGIPVNETTIANLEGNDFAEGVDVVVGVDQMHVIHLATHVARLVEYAQQYIQAPLDVPMEEFMNYARLSLPHIERHLQILSQDPTRGTKVEEYTAVLKQAMPVLQQASQEFEQVMQAQQQEKQRLAEENMALKQQYNAENMQHQREMMKIQLSAEAEKAKTDSLIFERNRKASTQIDVSLQKHAAKMAMDQQKFQVDMQKQFAQMQADMQKAQTEIQILLRKAEAAVAGRQTSGGQ